MNKKQLELIFLFKKLSEKIGRQPTVDDWNLDKETPSDMKIRTNFGGWTNFLKKMNLKPTKVMPIDNGKTRKGTRNKSRIKIVNINGYIQVFEPWHPVANKNGFCLEHRLIAWDYGILKNLRDIVHHKNGNKKDNRISNLEVMGRGNHTSHHFKGERKPRKTRLPCKICNELTGSKYYLCTKHYRLEWQRLKNIGLKLDTPHLLDGLK